MKRNKYFPVSRTLAADTRGLGSPENSSCSMSSDVSSEVTPQGGSLIHTDIDAMKRSYIKAIEALKLFIEAESGNGWSDMSADCIERIAYEAALQALMREAKRFACI